jgi:uncharacterized protein
MRTAYYLILISLLALTACREKAPEKIKTGGPEVIEFRVVPFNLTEVKLLDGPFKHATDLNINSLLNYEPDRLLANFRTEAGLKPKAEHYMGWENETLAGHSLGHYLSGLSLMYQTTGNPEFLKRVNYIVDELKACQDAEGDGYLGAVAGEKKILTNEVAKGNIRSHGFDLNGIWSPFYTQHKILAGLYDAYHLCGNKEALEVEEKFADWIYTVVSGLTEEQVQEMLRCEYGGISETFEDLYADTKNEKYLDLTHIFYQKVILDSLKAGKDILPGTHCNTNIPKLIALARLYELKGDTMDRKAATFFWNTVTKHHSYVTGGNGNDEYFGPADKLKNRLGEGTTETCNVYNMLKLSNHLFEWTASPQFADYYERALFNHILSSQNPENGEVTYNLSLDMGGYKAFQDPGDFTCCIGTAMESHSKYGSSIYFHNNDELYVYQYIASELTWKDKGLTLKQTTAFPEEEGTTIDFTCSAPVKMTVYIRYPYWAKNGVEIQINGKKKHYSEKPGSFIPLSRTWKSGDKIEVKIPFSLRLESMPDDSSRVAIMYGPVVLAGELGSVDDTAAISPLFVPVLMTSDRNPADWLTPVKDQPNTFTLTVGRPRNVTLNPFYKTYNERYTIYWDMFSEKDWKEKQDSYVAMLKFKKDLEKSTIDFFQPGEMQPERDHKFTGERTELGRFRERPNRDSRSGWFSMEMKTDPATANKVVAEYWGGFPGAKTFDISVDGKTIATENISNKKDGEFIFCEYPIPQELTKGKRKVTVRMEAHKGNMAGPLFSLRTVRQ